jgi:hypothetical protein
LAWEVECGDIMNETLIFMDPIWIVSMYSLATSSVTKRSSKCSLEWWW